MAKDFSFQKPKLSPRLEMVAGMVPECGRLIDIGTDHAFIPIWLIAADRCQAAIAADISRGPSDRAMRNIYKYGMEDKIAVLVQDGLGLIEADDNDCVVISGMGGYEIRSILMKKPVRAKAIVLQPQKSFRELRSFLASEGYSINREEIAEEKGHFYIAMSVAYTGIPYEMALTELEIGPCILSEKPGLYDEYISYRLKRMKKQLNSDPSLIEVVEQLETGG